MPTKTRRTTAPLTGRALREGHPLHDARKARDLDRLLATIERARGTSALAMWDEGRAFSTIRSRKLHIQHGYSSMMEWVRTKLRRNWDWVTELIAFAESFTRADVERHGRPRLLLGDRYARLTLADERNWRPDTLEVVVPTEHGTDTRLFRDLGEPELKLAIAHQLSLRDRREEHRLEPAQRAFVDRVGATVAEVVGASGRKGSVDLQLASDGDPDEAMVAIRVPYGDLAKVLRKLGALV